MRQIQSVLVIGAALAAPAAVAHAAVTPVGPFVGDLSENFENIAPPGSFPGQIFGGNALMRDTLAGDPVITFVLSNGITGDSLFAYDGAYMGLSPTGWTRFTFDTPIYRFGGYFAHLYIDPPPGTISFFDERGGLLETLTHAPQYGTWNWFGWESDTPIGSILVNTGPFPGVTAVYDNLEISYVPAPGALALLALGACLQRRRRH